MKKLIGILGLIFVCISSGAQNYTLLVHGGSGTFSINGSSYSTNSIILNVFRDSTYVELDKENCDASIIGANCVVVGMKAVNLYKLDGVTATTFTDIYNWYVTYMTSSGGGGTPASPTTSIQFNNAGSFGGDADFFWDGTAMNIRANGIAATKTAVVIFQNTVAATSGVPNQYPPSFKLLGEVYNNVSSITCGWWFNPTSTRTGATLRPAMSIDVMRDGSTFSPVLSFNPYAATPMNTFNIGGLTITSGNLILSSGSVNITTGGQLNMNGTSLIQLSQTLVADLPSAVSSFGKITTVTDALAPVVGDPVVAGGSATAMVWSNGTIWTVIGK